MARHRWVWLAGAGLFVLTGCVREEVTPRRTAQVIVQPPVRSNVPAVAPGPPPPPHSELVPPPPQGVGPVVWQPGHGVIGNEHWVWRPGEYVAPPPGDTTWVPGRWAQQPGGGWIWLEGHWA